MHVEIGASISGVSLAVNAGICSWVAYDTRSNFTLADGTIITRSYMTKHLHMTRFDGSPVKGKSCIGFWGQNERKSDHVTSHLRLAPKSIAAQLCPRIHK